MVFKYLSSHICYTRFFKVASCVKRMEDTICLFLGYVTFDDI